MNLGRSERAAERVLEALLIRDPTDLRLLEEIAYERGAIIRVKAMRGAEARLTMVNHRGIITLSPTITNPRRKRFSIAHELGHLEMHPKANSIRSLCSKGDLDDWGITNSSGNREQEANAFAAALLMPQRFFQPLCRDSDPSLVDIQRVADQFNTSLTATALRYTQFCQEAVAIVFSQNNIVKWFRRSEEFEKLGAFVEVRSRLDPESVAYSIYRGGGTDKIKKVFVASWLSEGNYRPDATIFEQSWAIPSSDGILTLLWIDDDITDDDYYWSHHE